MEVSRLSMVIDLDARGLAGGLNGAIVSFLGFERVASQAVQRIGGLIDALGGGKRLAVLGGLGVGIGLLAYGFTQALGPAIAFEDAFAGVLKTVDGTPAQLNGIRDGIIGMSREMPVAATELANIAAAAGQLGVQAPDILNFTRVIAELAATTDLGFEGAARNMARFLNVVDGGVQNIDQASNVLVDLGNNFATTESQILTFSTRLGASFAAAGAGQQQIQAVATAYSALGVEAEAGGSALSRVITEISDAAKLGGPELDLFADTAGLLPREFAAIAKENPVEAFRLFNQGLGDVLATGSSITPILEALGLSGIRISRVLTLGANSTGLLTAALNRADAALESNNARQIEYGKRAETTASRLQILQNRLTSIAISAGTPALDAFAATVDAIGDAAVRVANELAPLGSAIAGVFSGAGNAAGGFFSVLGSPLLGAAINSLTALSTILAGLINAFNSLGSVGVVLASLGAALFAFNSFTGGAATAVQVLALEIRALGFAGAAAKIGITGLVSALGGIAVVVGVVGLVRLGKAINEAEAEAAKAAKTFSDDFNKALEFGSADEAARQVDGARESIAELRVELAALEEERQKQASGGTFNFIPGADAAREKVISFFKVLKDGQDPLITTRAALEALDNEFQKENAGVYATRLASTAAATGLSRDSVLSLSASLGIQEQVLSSNIVEQQKATDQLLAYVDRSNLAGQASTDLYDKIIAGTAGVEDYARGAGISVEALYALAAASDEVDLEDVVAEDDIDRLNLLDAIVGEVNGTYGVLADTLGISTSEFLENRGAVDALAAAHDALRSAVGGAKTAMQAYTEQQDATNEAQEAFNAAIKEIGSEGGGRAAVEALNNLSIEYAALSGSGAEAVAFQRELVGQFFAAGEAAGYSKGEIVELIAQTGLVPPEVLIELAVTGASELLLLDEAREKAVALAGLYVMTLAAIDNAEVVIANARALGEAFGSSSYGTTLRAEDYVTDTVNFVAGAVGSLVDQPYTTIMDADDIATPTIDAVEERARGTADGDYTVELDANSDLAQTELEILKAALDDYENRENITQLRALGDLARTEQAILEAELDDFAARDNTTQLDANSAPATEITAAMNAYLDFYWIRRDNTGRLDLNNTPAHDELNEINSRLLAYERKVNRAKVEAETAGAERNLGGVIALLGGIRSKSVTVTVNTVSRGGGSFISQSEDGNILYPNFASGGFAGDLSRYQVTSPGRAGIYSAVSPGRIFAEPITEGEAYIPLSLTKRASALRVFAQTGRILGAFADGGVVNQPNFARVSTGSGQGAPTVVFNTPINIEVNAAPGMDAADLARQVSTEIDRAIGRAGRDISNRRLVA